MDVCYTCQAEANCVDRGLSVGGTMRHPSLAALVLRAALVFLTACCMVAGGVVLDVLAGSGPVGVLASLVAAVTFGVIMIYVIITSAFPGGGAR